MDAPINEFLEINNPELLTRMLTYCVRCPEVARIAVERLSPDDFDPTSELFFVVGWRVAQAYWKSYGYAPPQHFMSDMSCSVLIQLGYGDTAIQEQCRQFVDKLYALDESPWNSDYGIQLLNAFFNQNFAVRTQQLASQNQRDRESLMSMIGSEFQRTDSLTREHMDPCDIQRNIIMPEERNPTGCSVFDVLLGGGTKPAEVYGLLGPSGGGKTMLALQIAIEMARRGRYVDYWSYEQPIRDLQPRLLSCAAKIDRKYVEDTAWEKVPENIREKIVKAASECKGKLDLIDRSSEGQSVAEIEMEIQRKIAKNCRPDMVIIDWAWILLMRMTDTELKEERFRMQWMVDNMRRLCARYDINILVLHQLSTEVAKKSPRAKPQWFNSAEAGAFAWFLHYCIAIGTADEAGFCWLVGSKARNTKTQDIIVKMDGARNRFDPTGSQMTWDDKAGGFAEDGKTNKLPGSSIPDEEPDDDPEVLDMQGDYGGDML